MDEVLRTLVATLLQLVLSQPQFAPDAGGAALGIAPPAVQFVPQQEIARAACGQACGVRAYYDPGKGVFLDEELRPNDDVVARSILFHELVHHVQHHRNRYSDLPECERFRFREREAYSLQNQYLLSNRSLVFMGAGRIDCPGAPRTGDS
jgi:hypothetical protein